MLPAWLLLFFCMTAFQLVSNSKTFYRVEEPRTWKEAMWYCQEHYTDLADLQSVNSPVNIMVVYSYTSSTQAWIGLFYDVHISGLSWSSGSVFTTPKWSALPVFRDGLCATLYSWAMVPALGAASCTTQKPFICYYDPAVGHRMSLVSPLEVLTTLPTEAEVEIGGLTFIRIKQAMSWPSALTYCRNHYTDLADLQRVTDEKDKEILQSITSNVDAWIGLYFSAKINSLTWSSDLGSSIPEWLQKIPLFGQGLCAGLRIFLNGPPEIYALLCHEQKPFICFCDPSIGHRKLAEMPLLTATSSPKVTHPSEVTARTTPRLNTGTSTGPTGASQEMVPATWMSPQVTQQPTDVSSGTCDMTTPAPTTMGLTAFHSQGMVSISPLATPTPSGAVTSTEHGSHIGDTPTTTQAQHVSSPKHPETTEAVSSPKHPETTKAAATTAEGSEHSFGILKADFTISTVKDPEEMKDQLLSEIQEALKLVLGHEEFTLKWVGYEVNKK